MRRTEFVVVLLALGPATRGRPEAGATAVTIVRHAGKAPDAAGSPPTDAGSRRAPVFPSGAFPP